jgi:isochorismate synthase/2-succinyl-5-enolpyruvyl-6-hydroxy-3-cyclohexene-1-carboxylate synthase/2-succinyl-6-hydroxy-2,4-cyclohexadiene-1-carboxylate synthase/O-succinylbenzoate synthase
MKIKGAVVIAGSPGLKDKEAREVRKAKDDSRAHSLVAHGLQLFMENWYAGDLWKR